VQTSMAERNAGVPADKRIEARVGIHLGDVVEEADGDLMGDAVNVAARLESICEPGGICLSEDAYRQVRDKLQVRFSDLGEQHLKNIVRPVRAYALRLGVAVSAPAVGRKARNEAPVGSVRAAAFVAVLIAAGWFGWREFAAPPAPVPVAAVGTPSSASAEAPVGMQARQVAPFEKVEVSGPWTLDLTVGQPQLVAVAADPEALAHVVTEVQGGTLRVFLDRLWGASFDGDLHLAARISVPRPAGLQAHGGGAAKISGFAGGETAFAIDGAWKINAGGRLDTLKLVINGSGEASFDTLAAADVSLVINGSGEAQVRAERTLDVVVNGSGAVRYAGSPSIKQVIHGSGSLAAM